MEDKKRKIAIIGAGMIGMDGFYDAVKLKDCHKSEVILVENKADAYTIEVNGVKYKRIEKEVSKKSGKFGAIAAMTMALGGIGINGVNNEPRKRPHVDIIKEYGLIELKQSNLSRSDREWVKWCFEQDFKKV